MNNLFITIEGLPSQRKETLWGDFKHFSETAEHDYLFIAGSQILPLPELAGTYDARTELLYQTANRRHAIETLIDPALRAGTTVICQDWLAATYAYIHFVKEPGPASYLPRTISEIFSFHDTYCQGLYPELSFYVDVSPEESYAYLREHESIYRDTRSEASHRDDHDRTTSMERLTRLQRGYLDFAKMCAPYVDDETTRWFMGTTRWISRDVTMEVAAAAVAEARQRPIDDIPDSEEASEEEE